jgi:hypothetical protein
MKFPGPFFARFSKSYGIFAGVLSTNFQYFRWLDSLPRQYGEDVIRTGPRGKPRGNEVNTKHALTASVHVCRSHRLLRGCCSSYPWAYVQVQEEHDIRLHCGSCRQVSPLHDRQRRTPTETQNLGSCIQCECAPRVRASLEPPCSCSHFQTQRAGYTVLGANQ